MRVLVVHNRYRSAAPSGENAVVDDEVDLLRSAGVTVIPYLRSSDEIPGLPARDRLTLPIRPIHSRRDGAAIARLIRRERPDVLHLHNPYPLVSPSVVRVAQAAGVPVIQTVHNYRMVCLPGTFFRDGRECYDCRDRRVAWPGVLHACYRSSRPQSAVMATSLAVNHALWRRLDCYVALTPSMKRYLVRVGVPAPRITIRPNFAPDPGEPGHGGDGFLFVGRLSKEKGVRLLLEAWDRHANGSLGTFTIIGDGPEKSVVVAAASSRSDIEYLGLLEPADVAARMRAAAVVVVPSVWAEVMPRVVVEAFAHGRAVLGTNLGGLPDMIGSDAGWVVGPNVRSLSEALPLAQEQATAKGRAARELWAERYSPQSALDQILRIYEDVAVRR